MSDPVRLGVIGCGVIGHSHLRAAKASPLIEAVAVADLREDAARKAAEEFGVKTVYGNADAMLADQRVEAVVLAMPTAPRMELALRAFAKGKHVLTEKPVAMNAAEVRRMIAARGKLVAACCSSRHRFQPSAQAATDLVASGALGSIRVIHCRCIAPDRGRPARTPPAWRLIRALNGGGILMNWGCYDLDYLLGICGWTLKPRLVLAQTWRVQPIFESHVAPGSDAETHFVALIRCEGGEVISIERGEYCAAQAEDSWRIVGTDGALRLHMTPAKGKKIILDRADATYGVLSKTVWEGDEDHSNTTNGPVQDFAAAIREGRPPKTTLEQALVVQQISDAIYSSAESGKAVEIA